MERLKSFIILLWCLVVIVIGGCGMAGRVETPKKIDGWVRSDRPRKVNRKNIFDYMNGAGELYLAYSFVGLEVWNYNSPAEPNILLEIYDMGNPADAFGVLSFDLQGEEVGIGQKSVYAAGLLRFWKGRYFVRVLAEAETPAAKVAVLEIGKSIAAEIEMKAPLPKLPDLVARLPQSGLLPETIHYFHRKACLDYFYYLAEDNILDLDESTNAVMADYATPSGRAKLLVVQYAYEKSSLEAWRSFHAVYLNEKPSDAGAIHSKKIEGEQWVCSRRERKLLLMVFEGKSQDDCEELLRQAMLNFVQGG